MHMTIDSLYQLFLEASAISTDTRKIVEGALFFGIKGDRFNGNLFADKAIELGAKYAVVDEPDVCKTDQYILVDNVLETIQKLANHHRRQFDIPIIGITGSNGKTTSKELIGEVLNMKYNVLMTAGNLNNHLGVPLTLLRLDTSHEIAIIEMGANKRGDIKELAEIAEPTHTIITNIGTSHIEGFGSFQGIIDTKTELYRFAEQHNRVIFYNGADELLSDLVPSETMTVKFGGKQGEITGELLELTPFVNLKWQKENYISSVIESNLVGKYNFSNFLAAIAIGNFFNVPEDDITKALSSYQPSNNRSQVLKTERNTLIVDCYNANPASMRSALESFFEMKHDKKIAFLGDMLELGDISTQEHQTIIDLVESHELETYFVGTEFQNSRTRLTTNQNVDDLIKAIDLPNLTGHLILLKGSRGIKLEALIDHL